MSSVQTSLETKKLLLQFIIREINSEKESKKLAEVIHLAKGNASIQEMLSCFFEDSIVPAIPISDVIHN